MKGHEIHYVLLHLSSSEISAEIVNIGNMNEKRVKIITTMISNTKITKNAHWIARNKKLQFGDLTK